jgi:hypothetical protein
MNIRNPGQYRSSQQCRASAWIGHIDALAEEARLQIAREKRAKHPKKKQPRHVTIAKPLTPLNPFRV